MVNFVFGAGWLHASFPFFHWWFKNTMKQEHTSESLESGTEGSRELCHCRSNWSSRKVISSSNYQSAWRLLPSWLSCSSRPHKSLQLKCLCFQIHLWRTLRLSFFRFSHSRKVRIFCVNKDLMNICSSLRFLNVLVSRTEYLVFCLIQGWRQVFKPLLALVKLPEARKMFAGFLLFFPIFPHEFCSSTGLWNLIQNS